MLKYKAKIIKNPEGHTWTQSGASHARDMINMVKDKLNVNLQINEYLFSEIKPFIYIDILPILDLHPVFIRARDAHGDYKLAKYENTYFLIRSTVLEIEKTPFEDYEEVEIKLII